MMPANFALLGTSGPPPAAAGAPLALDGSAHGNTGGATTVAATLTTTSTNDVIIAIVTTNGQPITGIAGGGLTWNFRGAALGGGGAIEVWYAIAAGTLAAQTITATQTTSAFATIDVFGISGANTTTPFDGTTVTGTGDPISISTTAADTFIFGGFTNPTNPGAGWTLISGANFQLAEYQIVTTAQTNLSVSVGAPDTGTSNRAIADAVVKA